MSFEEKIIKNCNIRQRKLMRPARIAQEKPDTGVQILKKGAFFLIKDSADITVKYLAHLCYSSLSNPINELKGKFSQAEIIDFVGRSKEEPNTRQLLHIILTDIGSLQYKAAIDTPSPAPVAGTTTPVPALDYTISEGEDVYGDYEMDDDDELEPEPVIAEGNKEIDVDDVTAIINKLIETFQAK